MSGGALTEPVLLAEVVRSGRIESRHRGHLLAVDARGSAVVRLGDTTTQLYPRSAFKPLQALALLRTGLVLPADQLALAAASHSGEPMHVEGVTRMLADAGLSESALRCPALEGSRLRFNCSGKHAAMLMACVRSGWSTEDYLSPDHPLQAQVRATIAELCGSEVEHVGVDGCGLPLFTASLSGLASAFRTLVSAPEGRLERRVADAMRARPDLVGGTGRWVTRMMSQLPGLLVKDGAEGVAAGAAPGVGAFSVKIDDGGARPVPAVVSSSLRRLGMSGAIDTALDGDLSSEPVLGGGEPVGVLRVTGVTVPIA